MLLLRRVHPIHPARFRFAEWPNSEPDRGSGGRPVTGRVPRATPIRVALAGAGMISWYHLTAWRALGPRVRLVAVCDPDPGRAITRAKEFDIPGVYRDAEAMFAAERIDALDVASPRATHAGWVEAAADRWIYPDPGPAATATTPTGATRPASTA